MYLKQAHYISGFTKNKLYLQFNICNLYIKVAKWPLFAREKVTRTKWKLKSDNDTPETYCTQNLSYHYAKNGTFLPLLVFQVIVRIQLHINLNYFLVILVIPTNTQPIIIWITNSISYLYYQLSVSYLYYQ